MSSTNNSAEITGLIREWQNGEAAARAELFDKVYDHLHSLASDLAHEWRGNDRLRTTALVHELYLKLDASTAFVANDRDHFYRIASMAMRQVLVDYARKWTRQRRGGDQRRVELDEQAAQVDAEASEVLDVDRVLSRLELADPDLATVVQLRFFGGLTYSQIAEVLGVGRATVARRWKIAKAWIERELSDR